MKCNVPSETQEQIALFQWADAMKGQCPELELMFHVPNEGTKSAARGALMKRMGVKAGVPDIILPVARKPFHGLAIELKSKVGKPSGIQQVWLDRLREQGWYAAVCHGWQEASQTIRLYLGGNLSR